MPRRCAQCGGRLSESARFCGACGADVAVPDEDADAISRYREVMARFAGDGPLDAAERQQLETLRQRLDLSWATHQRLLSELAPPPTSASLRLAIDRSTMRHFEAGARCMLRLQIHNAGAVAMERVVIRAEVLGEDPLAPAQTPAILPGHSAEVSLWLLPRLAGFQQLWGGLHAIDIAGEESHYTFDGVQFRIGGSDDAPRVSVVHIDQRSARVVDNSRTSFAPPAEDKGGPVAGADWQPVPLQRPASPARGKASTGPVAFTVRGEHGRYDVTSTMAQGDLATLYGGRRASDSMPVVVKIADDRADNDLLHAEVSTLRILRADEGPQLKHLPVMLDHFETPDGRLGTVFEAIDGYDLTSVRERLPRGVPPRHMIWLARRCLSALGWAHGRGVLHGNLDPGHIMVRASDHNVWLVDWCYAIVEPAKTGASFRCHNEVYSPPEVIDRRPPLPSSDLYALGKCMIFAAGGDPAAKALPDEIDARLQRLFRFMAVESARGRAQDAWELYGQLDQLREAIWGPHQFLEFTL